VESVRQQIVISGVGGQGVLFVTRVLALAAMAKGLPVITSETHGMAQRGGTVVSHLKVGRFYSPLIRPATADGLLVLKPENVPIHGDYCKTGAWTVINSPHGSASSCPGTCCVDADRIAAGLGVPRSANLVLLGAAASSLQASGGLFVSVQGLRDAVEQSLAGRPDLLEKSMQALEAGVRTQAFPDNEADSQDGKV